MNHQDLINTCIFEQIQGLLFSDLSGPLIKYEHCIDTKDFKRLPLSII